MICAIPLNRTGVAPGGVGSEGDDQHVREQQMNQFKLDELMDSDVQLLGRVTYEGFAAAWPSRQISRSRANWAERTGLLLAAAAPAEVAARALGEHRVLAVPFRPAQVAERADAAAAQSPAAPHRDRLRSVLAVARCVDLPPHRAGRRDGAAAADGRCSRRRCNAD